MRYATFALLVILAGSAFLAAQVRAPLPMGRTFELASIKRNTSGATATSSGPVPGGGYMMVNGLVRALVLFAFPTESGEVAGIPESLASERYDVTAIAATNSSRADIQEMMRSLLVARFGLVFHVEQRERPLYVLSLARDGGRLGPHLQATTLDCSALGTAARSGSVPQVPLPTNGAPPCGVVQGGGVLRGGGINMSLLALTLTRIAGRVVIDKTGLKGDYEFTLKYSMDSPTTKPDATQQDAPSIFTALPEQLGLKLQPGRAPLDVLVVDKIERPTPD